MATSSEEFITPIRLALDRLRDEARMAKDEWKTKQAEVKRVEEALNLLNGKGKVRRRRSYEHGRFSRHVSARRKQEVARLMEQIGHPATVTEISEKAGRQSTWSGDAVGALVQDGYVELYETRHHGKNNTPTKVWALTDEGLKALMAAEFTATTAS